MKTSDFPSAEALTGYELIGVVQSESNVQTTVETVSGLVGQYPGVKVGYGSYANGFSSIAVGGGESAAVGSTATLAIGAGALTVAAGPVAMSVGSPSYVTGSYTVAVGAYNLAQDNPSNLTMLGAGNEGSAGGNYGTLIGTANGAFAMNQVAIGHNLNDTNVEGSVFIGGEMAVLAAYNDIGIGYNLGLYGPNCVALGTNSKAIFRGVAIGYNCGFQHNDFEDAGEASIAIGTNVYTPVGPAIGIGFESLAVYSGVSLGINLVARYSAAVGYGCNIMATAAVGIGSSVGVADNYGVAIGSYNCYAHRPYAMVLGSVADPAIGGTFVNGGVWADGLLRPVVFHQKLIGQTISPKKATAAWGTGDDGYTATVTYNTVGAIGNNYVLTVVDAAPDSSLSLVFSDPNLYIMLATDDPSTNTLLDIAGLFPAHGFVFGYTDGFDDTVISFTFTESFANGADGTPTTVLTADGNSPSSHNLPATFVNSLATVTGTVVAATPHLFEDTGDAANFTLGPVMVLQQGSGYSFIGTATLTLSSHTSGASGWDAPTLTISEDNTQLLITATNTDADVNWMAHLTFEASQDVSPP